MRVLIVLTVLCVSVLGASGCAGKGEVIPLNVQAVQQPMEAATGEGGQAMEGAAAMMASEGGGLTVAVSDFEDVRSETGRLGVRQHLGGGESSFEVADGKTGQTVASVVANYLQMRGWKAQAVGSNGMGADQADVLLSGRILEFSANAQSKIFRTNITVQSKIQVEAKNNADGSIVRMTLTGDGSDSVFWFDPEDVEGLLNAILAQNFDKLLANTKIENGLLRLK